MPSNDPHYDDDLLDRLIGQARWPEPQAEQTTRLRGQWRTLTRRRRARRAYSTLAAAAVLLVFVGIQTWRSRIPQRQPNVTAVRRLASRTAVTPSSAQTERHSPGQPPISTVPVARSPSRSTSIEVRDPNIYEQVLLMSVAKATPRNQIPANFTKESRAVEDLITAFEEEPAPNVDHQLTAMQGQGARWERYLWSVVAQGDASRRLGATRLLARIATWQSLPVLEELANDPATRMTAVLAIARLGSARNAAQLASIEPAGELRQALLRTLLERHDEESVALYLNFINGQEFRGDALVALDAASDPPIDLLLRFLDSPQKWIRLAAARSLARLPNPEIAERLSGAMLNGYGRQEALLALLLSSSDQAERILAQARQDLYLVASVHAAEQELRSLTVLERR